MHLFTTLLRRAVLPTVVVFGLAALAAQTDPSQARQGQPSGNPSPAGQPAARGTAAPPAPVAGAPSENRGNRGGNVPPWWREESRFSKELALTKDQIVKIEKLWDEKRPELFQLNEDLKRRENMLSEVIKDEAGEAQVKDWIARVERTRSQYNQTRQLMLYHMRQVLTAPQRVKFPQLHAQWQQEINKADLEQKQRELQKQMNPSSSGKPVNPAGKTDGKAPPEQQRGRPGQ